jgi:hypothetical protein
LDFAETEARAELCRFDWLHMQRRFGCSGAETYRGSPEAWSTAIATSPYVQVAWDRE